MHQYLKVLIMVHNKLAVYRESIDFVAMAYQLSNNFPKSELYGLSSQLRRASFSIPMNIAEGSSNRSTKDLIRYLKISLGSANEIETIFDLILKLGYCTDPDIKELSIKLYKIRKMLQSLINRLSKMA